MLEKIRKVYTLIFIRDLLNKKILLGFKKRGFGLHKWNGLGGKVEPGESLEQGAKRLVFFNRGVPNIKIGYKLKYTLISHTFIF